VERPSSPWRYDVSAGLVVALVALPLCLGIALASGAPLFAGLVTGVVGGLLVSRLSGSQLMVSGPAAGLTAIVVAAIAELGSFSAFLVAVVLAGGIQLVLGAVRAGLVAYFVPSSVIRGMLAGIGLLLVVKQLPYALGASLGVPGGAPAGLLTPVVQAARDASPAAIAIAVLSLALLAGWGRVAPAAVRRFLPAPLVVVAAGALLAAVLGTLPAGAFVQLPVPRQLSDLAAVLASPDWGAIQNPAVWKVAGTLAIVATLETLLSLEATDKLDPERRTSPANRELLAQGTGNIVAGLLGGLPMTGVIVRSAANVGAGGRTWRSAFVHGVILVVAVLSVPALLNHIPLAALAAVLIATGIKLASPSLVVDAWRRGPQFLVPFAVTTIAIVVEDLLIGIGVGLAAGLFFLLRDSYRNAYSYERRESADHHSVRLTLAEEVTFLNKAKILNELSALAPGTSVTIDGTRTKHLDMDVAEILHDFRDNARRKGVTVLLHGIPQPLAGAAH
jgi:SulP family sulfate permease